MLFWQSRNGAGPPGLSVWGWQEAGITAVTVRDPPLGWGPKGGKRQTQERGNTAGSKEELLHFPTSGLLVLSLRYLFLNCTVAERQGGQASDLYGSEEQTWWQTGSHLSLFICNESDPPRLFLNL